MDQARCLRSNGIDVTIISTPNQFSIFYCVVTICRKILNKKVYYLPLKNISISQILFRIIKFLFSRKRLLKNINGIPVIKSRIIVWSKLSSKYSHTSSIKSIIGSLKWYTSHNGPIDIIHAHNVFYSGVAAHMWRLKTNTPYIVTEHSSLHLTNEPNDQYFLEKKAAYANANNVFAVSNYLRNSLIEKGLMNDSCLVFPNFLSSLFTNKITITKQNTRFTLVCVARLVPSKAIDILISAFQLVVSNNSNVYLKIIGDGGEMDNLKKFAKDLNLSDSICFMGELSREQVKNELENSNLFILSSLYETFGVSIIEAFSCGLPVISTRCGGPEELINDTNGILVDIKNSTQLAVEINRVVNGEAKFDRGVIQKQALEKYSSKVLGQQLINKYISIIKYN
jgi:glycosyltransferase involved in cell wall biosynthesis